MGAKWRVVGEGSEAWELRREATSWSWAGHEVQSGGSERWAVGGAMGVGHARFRGEGQDDNCGEPRRVKAGYR